MLRGIRIFHANRLLHLHRQLNASPSHSLSPSLLCSSSSRRYLASQQPQPQQQPSKRQQQSDRIISAIIGSPRSTSVVSKEIRRPGKRARKLLQSANLLFQPSTLDPNHDAASASASAAASSNDNDDSNQHQQHQQHEDDQQRQLIDSMQLDEEREIDELLAAPVGGARRSQQIRSYLCESLEQGLLVEFGISTSSTSELQNELTDDDGPLASSRNKETRMLGVIKTLHRTRPSRGEKRYVPGTAALPGGATSTNDSLLAVNELESVTVVTHGGREFTLDIKHISFVFSGEVLHRLDVASSSFASDLAKLEREIQQRTKTFDTLLRPHMRRIWSKWHKQEDRTITPRDLQSIVFLASNLNPNSGSARPLAQSVQASMLARKMRQHQAYESGSALEFPWPESVDRYALMQVLRAHPTFFKSKGFGLFASRTHERPTDIDLPDEDEVAYITEHDVSRFVRAFQIQERSDNQMAAEWWYAEFPSIMEALEDMCLLSYGPTVVGSSTMIELFQRLSLDYSPACAYELLIHLGAWDSSESPAYYRFVRLDEVMVHTNRLQQQAEQLSLPPDICARQRVLLNGTSIAIDAGSASEVDDAVGFETLADGSTWLCVHVADVDRFVPSHSWLDEFASLRGYSVYMPDQSISMLPDREFELTPKLQADLLLPQVQELEQGPKALQASLIDMASLTPGRPNFCLTFMVMVDPTTGMLTNKHDIRASLVTNIERITFNEANSLLAGKPISSRPLQSHSLAEILRRLLAIAKERKSIRIAAGAVDLTAKNNATPKKQKTPIEGSVGANKEADEEAQQLEYDEEEAKAFDDEMVGDAKLLVEELMVVAGIVGAEYGRRHRIPMPYRTQQRVNMPSTSSKRNKKRSASESDNERLRAAGYALSPSNHVTMGLPAYARVTSPMRRYADLLCHRQIKAHMLRTPLPHSVQDIVRHIDHLQQRFIKVKNVEQVAQRYRILREIEANMLEATSSATLPAVHVFGRAAIARAPSRQTTYQAIVKSRTVPRATFGRYEEQVEALFPEWNQIMTFTMTRPTRIGERLNLEFTQVDAFEGTMTVREHKRERS